ncbi:hypothetical protein Taro_048604 [Colocasia esculenta]|uniref:Uncharacterized protein n=1 Tax=Colocasia esculenta TaxID=4460 RepID=A0A843X8K5_COLES|nr:hypothetical protein [Colocasia esculenta]
MKQARNRGISDCVGSGTFARILASPLTCLQHGSRLFQTSPPRQVSFRSPSSLPRPPLYGRAHGSFDPSPSSLLRSMEDPDAPLDFESEDPLLSTPLPSNVKKRGRVHPKNLKGHQNLRVAIQMKKMALGTKRKNCSPSLLMNARNRHVNNIVAEDEIRLWGQQVFGHQKIPPPVDSSRVINCKLLKSFLGRKPNSVLDLTIEKGETFLEGLLIDGWLLKLVVFCGSVEDSIASWTFYQMLYSSNKELQDSACDFWCGILPGDAKVEMAVVEIEWFPCYMDLKNALEVYGYLSGSHVSSSHLGITKNDSGICGPPLNIRCWLMLVAAFCRMRNVHCIFSTSEVEELFGMVIWLFLDRQLQGLSFLLRECVQSIISFFTDKEWTMSSEKMATSVANRVPKDANCLRIVECISVASDRSKSLRSEVAHQILTHCIEKPGNGILESLKLLISINIKDKDCDFFKLYVYLVLTENWLLSGTLLQGRPDIPEMWSRYLRNLSSQITSTDWRSYASKVRNRASYLLQNMHTWQDHKT